MSFASSADPLASLAAAAAAAPAPARALAARALARLPDAAAPSDAGSQLDALQPGHCDLGDLGPGEKMLQLGTSKGCSMDQVPSHTILGI